MGSYERIMYYRKQNGSFRLTPKQNRREKKKFNQWEKRFLNGM